MKCLVCEKEFLEEKPLHLHIARAHKTRIEPYYRKFFPRFDLLTGEGIKFRDKEFYLTSLFNTRQNLITYIKKFPSERTNVILKTLTSRKDAKDLVYAPSTVEARTCILPTPALLGVLNIDYNACCERVGLTPRYDYVTPLEFEPQNKDFSVIVDTREQRPLKLDCETFKSKLDFGDYTCRSHYKKLFIERKSLIDLCGTMSAGYDRIRKEFDRCEEFGGYIVVCVEEPISSLMSVGFLPHTKKVKASPEFLSHRVREVCQEYSCVQFLFIKGRVEMAAIIKRLFLMQTDFRKVDLQFSYDCERLVA